MIYYPTDDLKFNVARGLVKGATVQNIFGYNTTVNNAFIPLWEKATAYVYPTQGLSMTVTTDSTEDDGKAVRIVGLDENYDQISEDVEVNSVSPNSTTNLFFRINSVVLITGGINETTIDIENNSVVYGGIRPEHGVSQATIYTVPRGYEFYLYRIDAFSNDSTAAKPAIFRNCTKNENDQTYIVARTTFYNQMNIQRRLPFRYGEKSDIEFQLRTITGTHEVNCFGEGILIQKPI